MKHNKRAIRCVKDVKNQIHRSYDNGYSMARSGPCTYTCRRQRAHRRRLGNCQAHGHKRTGCRSYRGGVRHLGTRIGNIGGISHQRQLPAGHRQRGGQQHNEHTCDYRRHCHGTPHYCYTQRYVARDSYGDSVVGSAACVGQQRQYRWRRSQRGIACVGYIPADILPAFHALYFRQRQAARPQPKRPRRARTPRRCRYGNRPYIWYLDLRP